MPVKGGRIADTWEPLRFVAVYLGDTAWLAYSDVEIVKAEASMGMGQEEKPTQAAFRAVLAFSLDRQADVLLDSLLQHPD